MLALIPDWLLRYAAGLVVEWLVRKWGHSAAVAHIGEELAKHAPLPENITPAQSRNPNQAGRYQ